MKGRSYTDGGLQRMIASVDLRAFSFSTTLLYNNPTQGGDWGRHTSSLHHTSPHSNSYEALALSHSSPSRSAQAHSQPPTTH